MTSFWRNRRFPLQIQIATLFSLLMFLVGALLIGFNYWRANQLNIDNARTQYGYIGNNAAAELDLSTQTMGIAVNLLTTMPITTYQTLEQRFDSLPRLREILRSSPYANSVYAGYADGDMLLMRRLTPLNRANWQAPHNADWLVQSIDHNEQDPSQVRRNFLYFDDQLNLLRNDDKPEYLYDPRERGWYQASVNTDQQIMSPMYVFASSREIGTTLSRRAKNQHAVIGIDISLRTFSDLLRAQKLPAGSKMALISPQDTIIASLDPREVIRMNAERQISMASVETFPNPPLSELLSLSQDLPREQEQHLTFTYRDQPWFGSLLPINNAHGVFRLAI
ncbi:MAG: cache domain-containing protein, partial [Plesiomonas shigelloides]